MAKYFLFAAGACAASIISLDGRGWTLENGINVSIPASLPSQAHLDLFAAGIIGDPLVDDNDMNQLWVQRSNWTYSKTLDIQATSGTTYLVFDGLDTFTHVQFCGASIGNTDNQFRQYYFDITEVLSSCDDPTLSLNFGSASKIVLELAEDGDPLVNQANGVDGQEFDGKVYMRKQQNDFGWDWSPSMAPAGPWKSARVVQLAEDLYARNVLVDIYREGQINNLPPDQSKPFIFNASIDFLGSLPEGSTMNLLLESGGNVVASTQLTDVYSNNETITGHTVIDSSKVALWWPVGMGDRPLYNATITITHGDTTLASASRRVGFRTIVLNLSPVSDQQIALGTAPGSNWHFEINGREFYAKGSNFVPPDLSWARVNETRIRNLFEAAVYGNQNMLRIWSSGSYLPDWVYDMADEMGLLLWSEFQFSDAEYPTNSTFLANYEAEAYHNVRRVNHHPSLALWAGGNELEAIIIAYFFNSPLRDQYELNFLETMIRCVYANTRSISYIPSSTYNGYLSLDFNATRPQTPRYRNRTTPDALYANTDLYDYDATKAFNNSNYPTGRFATEFGFLSMPSLQSWQNAITDDGSLTFDSPAVLHRNRHYGFGDEPGEDASRRGIADMTNAVKLWYPQPSKQDPIANFSSWAWTTQVFQADYYANQIAFYRRGSGMRERQLGALYWQLDDLWVAPTWASIESNGRHKMVYYSTRDIFSPLIVRPYFNATTKLLETFATSDQFDAVGGAVSFSWIDWQGNTLPLATPTECSGNALPNGTTEVSFEVGPINSTCVFKYDNVSSLFTQETRWSNSSNSFNESSALLRISASGSSANYGQSFSHSSWFHPVPLANVTLPDPGLTVEPSVLASNDAAFVVTATEAVAAFVWLDHPSNLVQGYFEDNGFWLMKGESRTIGFNVQNNWVGDASWLSEVTVRSLWDNTTP